MENKTQIPQPSGEVKEQATRRPWNAIDSPIWGTDFKPPLSQVIENVRSAICQSRGSLNDIMSAFPAWKERFGDVAGLLTCGLVALNSSKEEIAKFEAKRGSLTDQARERFEGVESTGNSQPSVSLSEKEANDCIEWLESHFELCDCRAEEQFTCQRCRAIKLLSYGKRQHGSK